MTRKWGEHTRVAVGIRTTHVGAYLGYRRVEQHSCGVNRVAKYKRPDVDGCATATRRDNAVLTSFEVLPTFHNLEAFSTEGNVHRRPPMGDWSG